MSARRRGGLRFRAKHTTRIGPYFRRYGVSAGRSGSKAGWTSQGFKFGKLTVNTTRGTYTYDTPGPGAVYNDIPEWVMQRLPKFLTKKPS